MDYTKNLNIFPFVIIFLIVTVENSSANCKYKIHISSMSQHIELAEIKDGRKYHINNFFPRNDFYLCAIN